MQNFKQAIADILAKYGLKEVFHPASGSFKLERIEGQTIEQEWTNSEAYQAAEKFYKENIAEYMEKWKTDSVKYKELQALSEAEFARISASAKLNEASKEVEEFVKNNNLVVVYDRDYEVKTTA